MSKTNEDLKVLSVSNSCCGDEIETISETGGDIREDVQNYYANAVESRNCGCDCGDSSEEFYSEDCLNNLPKNSDTFSLGCGNPIVAAELKEGETVLDLGSGAGLDCFLSAKEVGKSGQVIGIDMTPQMLKRSTESAKKMGYDNVEFRKGYLEEMPVDDNSIDVVISNCVVNLSPDKSLVFNEISRVLKPGGRIAISDIVIHGEIPEDVIKMKDSWNSCAAGALSIEDFAQGLVDAGMEDVVISAKDNQGDLLDIMPEDELFSAIITARKPK